MKAYKLTGMGEKGKCGGYSSLKLFNISSVKSAMIQSNFCAMLSAKKSTSNWNCFTVVKNSKKQPKLAPSLELSAIKFLAKWYNFWLPNQGYFLFFVFTMFPPLTLSWSPDLVIRNVCVFKVFFFGIH